MTSPAPAKTARERAERIGGEADAWLARFNSGPLSASEARVFNDWLTADPDHEKAFRRGQQAMRNVLLMKGEVDIEALMRPSAYERVHNALFEAGQAFGRWSRSLTFYAGVGAVAAAALGAMLYAGAPTRAPASGSAPEVFIAAAPPLHETGTAEIRDVTLPDGSTVTLGAASSIDLAFTETERRVVLSSGEAFFDVRKDPERPFIVIADNTFVRVLGTKFDVNLGTDAVDIAVLEGRVEVIRPEEPSKEFRDEDIKHVLTAGQKVAAPKSGRVQPVEVVETGNVAAWRRGELIWIDKPVREIISDLNRYSATPIELRDPTLADLEYTLAIRAEDVPGGVETLAAALGVAVHTGPEGEMVLR